MDGVKSRQTNKQKSKGCNTWLCWQVIFESKTYLISAVFAVMLVIRIDRIQQNVQPNINIKNLKKKKKQQQLTVVQKGEVQKDDNILRLSQACVENRVFCTYFWSKDIRKKIPLLKNFPFLIFAIYYNWNYYVHHRHIVSTYNYNNIKIEIYGI